MSLQRCRSSYRAAHLLRSLYSAHSQGINPLVAVGQAETNGHGSVYSRGFAKLVSFPLAQTGEGISECELVAWAIKEGDTVSPFDKLCDVQSDKAAIEITSRYGGRVVALHHGAGDMVKVGSALLDLEVPDEEQVAPEHLAAAAAAPAAGAMAGTTSTTAAVASAAASAAAPPPLTGAASTASAKPAAAATHAEQPAGVAAAAVLPGMGGSAAAASSVTAVALGSAPAAATAAPPPQAPGAGTIPAAGTTPSSMPPSPSPPSASSGGVHATPAVRALAREMDIDLAAVEASGPGGRVTKADVLRHRDAARAAQQKHGTHGTAYGDREGQVFGSPAAAAPGNGRAQPAAAVAPPQRSLAEAMALYQRLTAATAPALVAPAVAGGGGGGSSGAAAGGEVVPLRGYRRAMVRSMTAAASVPLFHLHDEVDVGRLLALRGELRGEACLREQGVRLTLLPFLLKALSVALSAHPHINASLSPGGDSLQLHPHHNIGVAMATPSGLVVPNIKQVERKSVAAVAAELCLLQQLAAAGRLPGEALAGGTISVSNIGTLCGTHAAPLVSPPELAIVALGRTALLPRYTKQQQHQHSHPHPHHPHHGWHVEGGSAAPPLVPVPTSIMPVSWGADHRAVDGAALASFHATWRGLLEAPERLLLHTT